MKKQSFASVLDKFDSNLWYFHFKVPKKISDYAKQKDIQRFICTINGEEVFHCALMPEGDNNYFINVNKEIRKKLSLQVGDKVMLELEEDKSKYGLPVCEEFLELIDQDPEGDKVFHSLTPGSQRSLIYIVGKPKSSNLRLHKSLAVLEYLKESNGELDFKVLNEFMKNFQKL